MCRLRKLTYASPLFADVTITLLKVPQPQAARLVLLRTRCGQVNEETMEEEVLSEDKERVHLGTIPIMLKSKYCVLHELRTNRELSAYGECEFDQGGYFIVKGNERVLIAQGPCAGAALHAPPPAPIVAHCCLQSA